MKESTLRVKFGNERCCGRFAQSCSLWGYSENPGDSGRGSGQIITNCLEALISRGSQKRDELLQQEQV
jgi:hypothetical protein